MKQMNPNRTYKISSKGRLVMVEEYDPTTMVFAELTPDMRLTQEQIDMLQEAQKHPVVFEDDCPELTPAMIQAFRLAAQKRDAQKRAK